jgi:predicted GNAT superfamily acetyltransferase
MTQDSRASDQARVAAERAGVTVEPVHDINHLDRIEGLFAEIWDSPDGPPPVAAHLLKAFDLSGNYVSGAFDAAGELVGASAGFACVGPKPELHSHITGVVKGRAGAGVGYALKLHQRAWALERDIGEITWTFDPLVRRNTVFNVAKLGARPTAYLENVYGSMEDSLNGGQESDRLWVRWELASPEVADAADGRPVLTDEADLPVLVDIAKDGGPELAGNAGAAAGVVRLPPDIESLRLNSPEDARRWRLALRQALAASLDAGAVDVGVSNGHDLVLRPGT